MVLLPRNVTPTGNTPPPTTLVLATSTPSLIIARTAYDAAGQAVEINEMTLDAGAFILQYDFDA